MVRPITASGWPRAGPLSPARPRRGCWSQRPAPSWKGGAPCPPLPQNPATPRTGSKGDRLLLGSVLRKVAGPCVSSRLRLRGSCQRATLIVIARRSRSNLGRGCRVADSSQRQLRSARVPLAATPSPPATSAPPAPLRLPLLTLDRSLGVA